MVTQDSTAILSPYFTIISYQLEPHKAVAEVAKIGNL